MRCGLRIPPATARRATVARAIRPGRCIGPAVLALALFAPAAHAADPGASGAPGKGSASVKLEAIPGSTVKRVVLTAKAAERLGIATAKVGEEPVVRKQMVSGLIVAPMDAQSIAKLAADSGNTGSAGANSGFGSFGGFGKGAVAAAPATAGATAGAAPAHALPPAATPAAVTPATAPASARTSALAMAPAAGVAKAPALAPAAAPAAASPPPEGGAWVLVTLSAGEWERLAKDRPVRLLPLDTRNKPDHDVLAAPSGIPPVQDVKRAMLTVYYVVQGKDPPGIAERTRVRVELALAGSDEPKKIVPYSAVYYDAKGATWVYENPRPLVFERRRVTVDTVIDGRAVLSAGPPVGTTVVSVGAPLLYGAEIFGK